MMGLLESMVSVGGEYGQPDWSMKMVDGGDVDGQGSELLSYVIGGWVRHLAFLVGPLLQTQILEKEVTIDRFVHDEGVY